MVTSVDAEETGNPGTVSPDTGRGTVIPLPALLLWTILVFSSLGWNLFQGREQTNTLIYREAESVAAMDRALHQWATHHGGVYVPTDGITQSNPELLEHRERDITTPSGRTLTLLSPNAMLKELSRQTEQPQGVHSRLVGSASVRRGTKPDAWEDRALKKLMAGAARVEEVVRLKGQPQLRLAQPLMAEEDCRHCHNEFSTPSAVANGTVVGAVSVTLPLAPYMIGQVNSGTWMAGTYALVWLVGLAALLVGSFRLQKQIAQTERAKEEARELARSLERRVEERTAELRSREEYLRRVMIGAADGIVTVDDTGRIETCNPAAARVFGYDKAELEGQPATLLFPPGATAFGLPVTDEGSNLELEGQRRNGALFPLSAAISRLEVEGRALLVAILRDLEHEKHLEAEHLAARELAEAARRQADRANRAKSEFLSSVSHELRTPLNSIIGFAQLLLMSGGETLSPTQTDQVRHIETAGDHLLSLINEILDLSRIEAGGMALEIGEVGTAGILQAAMDLIAPLATQRQVTLVNRWGNPADLPAVRADAIRLQQVLVNLLSNAVKYNRQGGKVMIGCGVDRGRVCLEIADTGRGIDPERMAELFQPFNRLGAEALDVEGAGIGLVISRRLVELMDGMIEVESTPGEGSLFRITLPAANAVLPDDEDLPVRVLSGVSGRHVVLLVEDNAGTVRAVETLLSRFPDFALISARTTEAGLRIARLCQPGAVLVNANLPGIGGFAFLAELRRQPETATVPVIGFSSSALPRDVRRALDAGFQTFLTKPLNMTLLLDAIRLAIASARETASIAVLTPDEPGAG